MIFTFYSYKGGVGRSMAMANIGHWLRERGLDVILVDWDLEAPGLESFFTDSPEELEKIRSLPGVIDLLYAYVRQYPFLPKDDPFKGLPPIIGALYTLKPPQGEQPVGWGTLRLLSAGWRSGDRFPIYAESVQSFDWAEFYDAYRGEEYFNWFREQLTGASPVVLIDSRTGVTEMGGVCTRQLADVVTVLCAPNRQNMQGCLDMVQSFRDEDLKRSRGRDLRFVIVPARVDDQDSKGYESFRDKLFVPAVKDRIPPVFNRWKRTSWDLEIPYMAEYSYREGLVAGGTPKPKNRLDKAYRQLAAHLTLFTPEDHPMWLACREELVPLAATAGIDLGVKPWEAADAAFAKLPSDVQETARGVLVRLVDLSPQSVELDSLRHATLEDFEDEQAAATIEQLIRLSLVTRTNTDASGSPIFTLADPKLATGWPRLRSWIASDRKFLLRRQELTEQAGKWRESRETPDALLRDAALTAAVALRTEGRSKLNALERAYVRASVDAEAAARERAEGEARRLAEETARAEKEAELAREAKTLAEAAELRAKQVAAARARSARRWQTVSTTLAIVLVAAGVFYRFWSQSEAAIESTAISQGRLIKSGDVEPETFEVWRQTLAAARQTEVLEEIASQSGIRQESLFRAQHAVWLKENGLAPDLAEVMADSALKGLPTNDPSLIAQTIGILGSAQIVADLPERATALLNPFLSDPAAYLNLMTGSHSPLEVPSLTPVRAEALKAVALLADSRERLQRLVALARSSRIAGDNTTAEQALALARSLAQKLGTDADPDVLTDLAELSGNPGDLLSSLRAARTSEVPSRRFELLARIARATNDAKEREALFAEAFAVPGGLTDANGLSPSFLAVLESHSNHGQDPLESRLRDALRKIAQEGTEASVASTAIFFARMGYPESIQLAESLTSTDMRVQTLADVAVKLQNSDLVTQEDTDSAMKQVLGIVQSTPSDVPAVDAFIDVLPWLTRTPEISSLVNTINRPAVYLAWVSAGGNSADLALLEKAEKLIGELTEDDSSRHELLAQLGSAYASLGSLRAANRVAGESDRADTKLQIYTAILRYRTLQSRPDAKEFFDRLRAGN